MTSFLLLLLFAMMPGIDPGKQGHTADVLIQAGHEGRPASCALFPKRPCNLGAAGEREATPIVADEAAKRLRAAGLRVVHVPADYLGHYHVRAAIFIHFDGAQPACTTGASIGYPQGSADAARAWRAFYAARFPFRFMRDNFTTNLSRYYGFRTVDPNPNTLVVEFGEITCPAQRGWLVPRYKELGDWIAQFLLERLRDASR